MAAHIERLVIATRESALAMWQAEHVRDTLRRVHPGIEVVIDGMTTQGDQILDRSLSKVGGKGLFVKELEAALLAGRADLAVHSLKDVPMTLAPGMALGAIMTREDPSDAFVSGRYASPDDLPEGAIVGTSSLRREAQFRAAWPHVQVRPVRGNVNTRLAKLDRGEFDAILLASAGLLRLGFESRIRMRLEPARCIPSPGQGALAIEVDGNRPEMVACLAPLHHRPTALAVFAERAVSRALGGDCTVPLGAHATWSGPGRLHLAAILGRPDGTLLVQASDEASIPVGSGGLVAAESLGRQIGERLLADGGAALLAAL